MRFHCNTTPDETIAFMRDHAIKSKAPAAMIDALDALVELLDRGEEIERLGEEIERLGEEVSALESDKNDLREELEQAAEALQLASDILESIDKNRAGKGPAEFYDTADLKGIARQLKASQSALERHKT
jgi:archaellum component FlaC